MKFNLLFRALLCYKALLMDLKFLFLWTVISGNGIVIFCSFCHRVNISNTPPPKLVFVYSGLNKISHRLGSLMSGRCVFQWEWIRFFVWQSVHKIFLSRLHYAKYKQKGLCSRLLCASAMSCLDKTALQLRCTRFSIDVCSIDFRAILQWCVFQSFRMKPLLFLQFHLD